MEIIYTTTEEMPVIFDTSKNPSFKAKEDLQKYKQWWLVVAVIMVGIYNDCLGERRLKAKFKQYYILHHAYFVIWKKQVFNITMAQTVSRC